MIRLLKRILPHSLLGRFLLIIICPMLFMQIIALYIFLDRHSNDISKHSARGIAGEIAIILLELDRSTHERGLAFLSDASEMLYLRAQLLDKPPVIPDYFSPWPEDDILPKEITIRIPYSFWIFYDGENSDVYIYIALNKQETLEIVFPRKRLITPTIVIFLIWMIGSAIILVTISSLFARNQIRSVTNLAKAAEQFGQGQEVRNFKPSGATEIRQCAHSFLLMQERIKRYITQRTDLLSAVSHDLRTPLTRMKLEISLMEQTDAAKALLADVSDMEHMVNEYLAFVKGSGNETRSSVPIDAFWIDLQQRYHALAGNRIHFTLTPAAEGRMWNISDTSLRRAIANIIDNGLRYASHVYVSTRIANNEFYLTVEDDGPSIPETMREEVFRPFFRLDNARNLNESGVGLGLAITRDIITSHGGSISLHNSPTYQGLLVTVILPL